jgi:hypothetical protein
MKYDLLERISVVHTVKCCKTADFEIAVDSFSTLEKFKVELMESQGTDELSTLKTKIDDWASTHPIVFEVDIEEILGNPGK